MNTVYFDSIYSTMDGLILDLIDLDESEPFVWTDHVIGTNCAGIVSTIKAMASTCSTCEQVVYYSLKVWRGKKVCIECWKHEKEVVSVELHSFLAEQYAKGCEFCGRKKIKNERFHFDHKNMFEKNYNVGCMIEHGCSKEELIAEIDKCQLLCISCHSIVTKFEFRYGFIHKKRKFNIFLKKKTEAEVAEYRQRLAEEYNAVIVPLYATIRSIVKGEL